MEEKHASEGSEVINLRQPQSAMRSCSTAGLTARLDRFDADATLPSALKISGLKEPNLSHTTTSDGLVHLADCDNPGPGSAEHSPRDQAYLKGLSGLIELDGQCPDPRFAYSTSPGFPAWSV
jgi:hypothetical protein